MNKLRLAVLISGGGTNLQSLIDRSISGKLAAEIVVVASDRPEAQGLERARIHGIPTHVIDYSPDLLREADEATPFNCPVDLDELDRIQKILKNPDREKRLHKLKCLVSAEQQAIRILEGYTPDYICLAGFMRLLTPFFLGHFNKGGLRRVINIHPALLPSFPGQHGYEDTLSYGCKWGGITVHFADEGEDTGVVLSQTVYPIWPDDSSETVRTRGLALEYELYAQVINWLAAGQVEIIQGSGGRDITLITDPAYKDVMRKFTIQALS